MICKYCGAKLISANKVCPECGKAGNIIEGGNGFWDIAQGSREERTAEQIVKPEKKAVKAPVPIALCALFCILCLLTTITEAIISNNRMRLLKTDYESRMSEQATQYEADKAELQAQLEQIEQSVEEIATEPASEPEPEAKPEPDAFSVLSYPAPATCKVGFHSLPENCLFSLHVTGTVNSFKWEKQAADGTWVAISFDKSSINRELGLRLEENISEGTSNLFAIGLTPESFGLYRCTAIGNNGSVQLPAVELIKDADIAQGAEESSTGDKDAAEASPELDSTEETVTSDGKEKDG